MAKKQPTAGSDTTEPTFEEALAQLERIVTDLEDGQLGLAESLTRYEAGMEFLKHCYRQLDEAEQRIELLTGLSAQGEAEVEPFDEQQATLEAKRQNRSRRRSRPDPTATDRADKGPPALF